MEVRRKLWQSQNAPVVHVDMHGFNQHTCVFFFVIYADHKKEKLMPEGGCGFSKLQHVFFKTISLPKKFSEKYRYG